MGTKRAQKWEEMGIRGTYGTHNAMMGGVGREWSKDKEKGNHEVQGGGKKRGINKECRE